MRKVLGLILAVLAVGSMGLAQKSVGVVLKTLANPFWGAMREGIEEGGKRFGFTLIVQAVPSEQDVEPQLNTCLNVLQRNVDALVVAAINATNLLPCIREANRRGIPVVDLDANLDPAVLQREVAFSISSDNRRAGAQAAEYVVQKLGRDFQGKVLIIEGLAGNPTSAARRDGFRERLQQLAPRALVVASLPGDWDRLKAANITNDVLQRHPDLAAIYAANDTMALGAVEALFAAGRGGRVLVVGTDGNADAVRSIRAGRLNASVAQLPYLVGYQALENLAKVFQGQAVPARVIVPTLVIDRAVLEEGREPLLQYLR
jgi:ABC-type sugar transport system substrate-binding protein